MARQVGVKTGRGCCQTVRAGISCSTRCAEPPTPSNRATRVHPDAPAGAVALLPPHPVGGVLTLRPVPRPAHPLRRAGSQAFYRSKHSLGCSYSLTVCLLVSGSILFNHLIFFYSQLAGADMVTAAAPRHALSCPRSIEATHGRVRRRECVTRQSHPLPNLPCPISLLTARRWRVGTGLRSTRGTGIPRRVCSKRSSTPTSTSTPPRRTRGSSGPSRTINYASTRPSTRRSTAPLRLTIRCAPSSSASTGKCPNKRCRCARLRPGASRLPRPCSR